MKAIFNNKLYQIASAEWRGLHVLWDNDEIKFINYDEPGLIIDPTDDEVRSLDKGDRDEKV